MSEDDPTTRFSDRVVNYARYRPGYPPALITALRDDFGLGPDAIVADVGSGTGILTRLLLPAAARVYAVEPNPAMRAHAEATLSTHPHFVSVDGRSEATTLPDASIDLVTVAQAFHWFEPVATRAEFKRILRPAGWVALLWNERDHREVPLMRDYETALADFGLGYHAVRHRSHAGDIESFFSGEYHRLTFYHERLLDFEALWGGFLSASYAPRPDDPAFEPMRVRLRQVFEDHQRDGVVSFAYRTALNVGRI